MEESKLRYLRLEDNTVSMISDKEVINCLKGNLPDQWRDIFLSKDKEERKRKVIDLWFEHLGMVLPDVTKKIRNRLEDIELIQKKSMEQVNIVYYIQLTMERIEEYFTKEECQKKLDSTVCNLIVGKNCLKRLKHSMR